MFGIVLGIILTLALAPLLISLTIDEDFERAYVAIGLAAFGLAFLVIGVLLRITVRTSDFLQGFGLAFSGMLGTISVVCVVVLAIQRHAELALAWSALGVELAAGYLIFKGTLARKVRTFRRRTSDTRTCPNCGRKVEASWTTCRHCGAPLTTLFNGSG